MRSAFPAACAQNILLRARLTNSPLILTARQQKESVRIRRQLACAAHGESCLR